MKEVLIGGRGSAVEDIQRRLLSLGFDIGSTGVDGVFLGKTQDAVTAFQLEKDLPANGVVDAETWSALVDATFMLGDRMLYLRLPHFHGHDVKVLQEALNALGFSCGDVDGIFGAFSERAVREFQRNCGQSDDGIVGIETVRAIENLKHVWSGKDSRSPSVATVASARAAEVLQQCHIVLSATDEMTHDIAGRIINLAFATSEGSGITLVTAEMSVPLEPEIHFRLMGIAADLKAGIPVVAIDGDELWAFWALHHRDISLRSGAGEGRFGP